MELETMQTGATGSDAGSVPTTTRRVLGLRRAFALATITALTVGGSAALAAAPAPWAGGTSTPATGTAPDPAKVEAAFKAYAACMRSHGVDMPDPVTVTSGAGSGVTAVTGSALVPIAAGGVGPVTVAPPAGAVAGAGTIVMSGSPLAVDPGFEAADKACASILTDAGIPAAGAVNVSGASSTLSTAGVPAGASTVVGIVSAGASAADTAKLADQMKTYASCMRTHGVDIPDPKVDAATGAVQLSMSADPSSDAFTKADAACATGGFSMAPPAGALPAILAAPAATPGK